MSDDPVLSVIDRIWGSDKPLATLAVARVFTPHPGPQSAFLASDAYEVLYGGAAGGGKSDALLYGPLGQCHIPKCRVLFLRRTFPELREMIERALPTFSRLGGEWNVADRRWRFPSGATYEFGYCATYNDVLQYQGKEFTEIAVDEVGQWPEERMWTYLMSRNRATDPRLAKRMRASANPGGAGHVWLKKRFIDRCDSAGTPVVAEGVTRAFFAARLSDNPTLEENDPGYRARLSLLPEITRRQLLDGDWSAGEGLALSELNREVHLGRAFSVPEGWYQWGAFDWGFNHPFCAGWFGADPDGTAYLVDSVFGRRLLPHEIASRITDVFPVSRLTRFHAGHDIWSDIKARGENVPTVYEQLRDAGVPMQRANIARVSGLNNLRQYIAHGGPTHQQPRFLIMDTPSNRRVFECLEGMVVDPDHVEDALKRDADDYGNNGDDAYDMVRYGLAARPLVGKAPDPNPDFRAFSQEALDVEIRHKRTVAGRKERGKLNGPKPGDEDTW